MTTSADEKAAPGFAEFRFDDGAYIGIAANAGQVSIIQMQGSTQGRGAAFLTVEKARELADAIIAAAAVAAELPSAPAPDFTAPTSVTPAAPALDPNALLGEVAALMDRKFAERDAQLAAKAAE
jgi:hypothetical protein